MRSRVRLVSERNSPTTALKPSLRASASIPSFSDTIVPTIRRTPCCVASAMSYERSTRPRPHPCQSSLSETFDFRAREASSRQQSLVPGRCGDLESAMHGWFEDES
jgi:hypothetical protein